MAPARMAHHHGTAWRRMLEEPLTLRRAPIICPQGEMTEHNIELGVIGEDRQFRILTPAEIRDYLDEAN